MSSYVAPIVMMLSCLFLALSLLHSTTASPLRRQSGYPAPVGCTGNCTFIHDPSVIRAADGTYYRFSTNGNIAIATADDLTGPWTYQGALLPEGSSITLAPGQEMWAPDVFLADGTYYAFYAVSKLGLQNSSIGVATSTSLAQGTWTDQGAINIPKSSEYNLIDANLFHQNGEPYYFSFGSAWEEIFQTQLTLDSGLKDQPAGVSPTQLAYNATLYADGSSNSNTEGSYQFWYPDGDGTPWYYLFFSNGKCCGRAFNGGAGSFAAPGDEYKVLVCRSSAITGPYVDQNGNSCKSESGGTLVLMSHDNIYAPGGQGVFYDDKVGRVVLYYHYVDLDVDEGYLYENFRFGFNYLDFSSGWPVVVA